MQLFNRITLLLFFAVMALNASAQWKKGSYYDVSGNKNTGLIKRDEQHILYKPTKKDKEIKLTAAEINGFMVDKDSFRVSRAPVFGQPVIVQVLTNGPTKIYVSRPLVKKFSKGSMIGGLLGGETGAEIGGHAGALKSYNGYYYGQDENSLATITMQNFVDITSTIMADKPKVTAKIKDKTFRYGDMDELVIFYNTGVEPSLID
ncbi:hypothetical protein LJ707_01540 [Mucilaginibacter sp. UR6-1]|uniref:hypothetical protein n=1 Tax=Mucilaginibacter sp. UR6-1 TaxID=1435643 RepID=UPI001E56BBAB|nr:hypothetical protein [Mucilaginibacter sp. UR6-1]MCC8407595.1 hypothetical protein [Mucilaginibacter sp. UR6-1]